jgi:hypothetical protein
VLEYYAMAKPSKEGLAKELARRNVSLNKETKEWAALWTKRVREDRKPPWPSQPPAPYGPNGTTDWGTMLTHIKRVFRKHKEACAAFAVAPPEIREEDLRNTGNWCRQSPYDIIEGLRPRRLRSISRRRGTK